MGWSISKLEDELRLWKESGLVPRFWWRDDDGHAMTPALERATNWSNLNSVPGLFSAIPAKLQPSFADGLQKAPLLWVAQHGWSHTNHVPAPGRPSELGSDRSLQSVVAELREGNTILAEAVPRRYLPVVVPPWNRLSPELACALPGLGYIGLSSHWGLHREDAPPGLCYFDTHVDASERGADAWTGASEDSILGNLIHALQVMRNAHSSEPIGILTHHLFMGDNRTWDVLARVVDRTRKNGGLWLAPRDLFSDAHSNVPPPAMSAANGGLLSAHPDHRVAVIPHPSPSVMFDAAAKARGRFVGGKLYLHPAGIDEPVPHARFELTLDKHEILSAHFGIDGTQSQSIAFDFVIEDSTGGSQRVVAYCNSGSYSMVRTLRPMSGKCHLTLSTRMADEATTNAYAWAFFSEVKFLKSIVVGVSV